MKGTKRRRILIDGLQVRLLAFNLGYLCVYSILVALFLLGPLVLRMHSGDDAAMEGRQAAVELLYLHARILPAFLIALCAFAVHGVFFSHRIAGPLYRFKQVFRAIRDGEIPRRVKLREGDYLADEARELNLMLVGLRLRLGEVHARNEMIGRRWSELEKALESGDADDIERRLAGVKAELARLGSCIGSFDCAGPAPAPDTQPGTLEELPPIRPRPVRRPRTLRP